MLLVGKKVVITSPVHIPAKRRQIIFGFDEERRIGREKYSGVRYENESVRRKYSHAWWEIDLDGSVNFAQFSIFGLKLSKHVRAVQDVFHGSAMARSGLDYSPVVQRKNT